jgi:hypothetical protein
MGGARLVLARFARCTCIVNREMFACFAYCTCIVKQGEACPRSSHIRVAHPVSFAGYIIAYSSLLSLEALFAGSRLGNANMPICACRIIASRNGSSCKL